MSEPMDISLSDEPRQTSNSRQAQLGPDESSGPDNPAHSQYRYSPMNIDVTEAEPSVAGHEQGRYTEFPGTLATRGTDHSIHDHHIPPANYPHNSVMTNPSTEIGWATHALPRLQEDATTPMQDIEFQPDIKQENISPGHSGSNIHGYLSGQLCQFAAPQDLASPPYSQFPTHNPLIAMNPHSQTSTVPVERISSVGAAWRGYQMSASAAAPAPNNPRYWVQARGSSGYAGGNYGNAGGSSGHAHEVHGNTGGNFPQAPRGRRAFDRPVNLQDRRFFVSNVSKNTSLLEIAYFFYTHLSSDASLREKWLQSALECVGEVEDIHGTRSVENVYTYRVRYHDARQAFNTLVSLNNARCEVCSAADIIKYKESN
ncbi:hypothetical protein N7493_007146 [Penicillium malachiteum]|uniref:Uncharacterized protein n=1 Tax=Penicillium malachiteum TaxID=1324776 RepID=A0AAD6HIU5_9EURO|nr:hypothetical protein N7493_007146 [Penicillium malachiteum]